MRHFRFTFQHEIYSWHMSHRFFFISRASFRIRGAERQVKKINLTDVLADRSAPLWYLKGQLRMLKARSTPSPSTEWATRWIVGPDELFFLGILVVLPRNNNNNKSARRSKVPEKPHNFTIFYYINIFWRFFFVEKLGTRRRRLDTQLMMWMTSLYHFFLLQFFTVFQKKLETLPGQ